MVACVICERAAASFRIKGTQITLCAECAAVPALVKAYRAGDAYLRSLGEAHRALNPRAYGEVAGKADAAVDASVGDLERVS